MDPYPARGPVPSLGIQSCNMAKFNFRYSNDGDDDWRSQLDSRYSGSEYSDLISLSSKINRAAEPVSSFAYAEASNVAKKDIFDAIRFPPVPAVDLPDEILKRDYEQDFELRASYNAVTASVEDNDSVAALDFLEGMLVTTLDKAVDIRSSVIENGSYVLSLPRTPSAEETEYMKTVILENMVTLRDESLILMTEMEAFRAESIDEMIGVEAISNPIVRKLRQNLVERANLLKSEIAASALVVDGLHHYSNSIVCLPTDKVCKLDGIFIDWSAQNKLQNRVQASNRSLNFADFMRSHGFPVCNDIYSYLQSTKSYGNVLSVSDYHFKQGEFKTVLEFFDLQQEKSLIRLAGAAFVSIYQSIKSLAIQRCEFSDRDCHALASKLSKFAHMHTLNLRENRITYSGVASLSSAFFENGSNIRCLRLDHNHIKSDGALFIAQVLHKMPFLEVLSLSGNPLRDKGVYYLLKHTLNPLRSVFAKLHRPTTRWAASAAGSYFESDTEGEEEATNAENEHAAAENKLETPQQRFLRKRILKKCYFDDYFKSHYSLPNWNPDYAADEDDEVAYGIAQREKAQWINKEEDEFNMDGRSEYSDSDEPNPTTTAATKGTAADIDSDAMTLNSAANRTQVSAAVLDSVAAKLAAKYGHCRALIRWMMKIRVKLVALNAFVRLLRPGSILSSLSVAACKLSSDVVPTLAQALRDNQNIVFLDLSQNPDLLVTPASCVALARLIETGGLNTLLVNNCGVNDRGFMELTRGASLSRTIRSLELSDNHIGPTGANWAATVNKVFFLDTLTIGAGFHSSAPFKRKGDPSLSSVFDEMESKAAESTREGTDPGKGAAQNDDDSLDLRSYLDTDLFDGEEDDDYLQDSLDMSGEEGVYESETEAYVDEDGAHTVLSRSTGVSGYVRQGLGHGRAHGAAEEDGEASVAVSRVSMR